MAVSPEEQAFINDLPKAKITKRLPDCPAERLAQCRGESVPPASDNNFAAGQWREGSPPHPWDSEWFLAQLHDGSYAVLRPLPEEFTYDFSTADATYLMRHKVKRWAQLSDSNYVEPECKAVPPAGDVEVLQSFRSVVGGLSGLSWEYFSKLNLPAPTKHGEVIELVDRAHVTRLTAERDGATRECQRRRDANAELIEERDAANELATSHFEVANRLRESYDKLQSELTKAREFISSIKTSHEHTRRYVPPTLEAWRARCMNTEMDAEEFLTHQSAPAGPNQTGEQS